MLWNFGKKQTELTEHESRLYNLAISFVGPTPFDQYHVEKIFNIRHKLNDDRYVYSHWYALDYVPCFWTNPFVLTIEDEERDE